MEIAREWDELLPDLRAALAVALFVILLEIVSDAIPLFGWLICLPLAVMVYSIQGVLTGVFLRKNLEGSRASALHFLGLGARSAVWTGLLSLAVSILTVLALIPVSLGSIVVGLPALLVSFVVDLGVNVFFSALGSWVYAISGGKGAVGFSCVVGLVSFVCFWVAVAAMVVGGILVAVGIIPRPLIH